MNTKDARIVAYTWHGLRRYSAMSGSVHLGPARTTMLVALSDAHIKGTKPEKVYDTDRGVSVPIEEWKE